MFIASHHFEFFRLTAQCSWCFAFTNSSTRAAILSYVWLGLVVTMIIHTIVGHLQSNSNRMIICTFSEYISGWISNDLHQNRHAKRSISVTKRPFWVKYKSEPDNKQQILDRNYLLVTLEVLSYIKLGSDQVIIQRRLVDVNCRRNGNISLQWYHTGSDGVSNHQPRHC